MSHTKEITAREAKNNFGELLESAQREPVRITKNGRKVAVVLSLTEYERLENLEDAFWGEKARIAGEGGFLGVGKSEKLLKDFLNDACN